MLITINATSYGKKGYSLIRKKKVSLLCKNEFCSDSQLILTPFFIAREPLCVNLQSKNLARDVHRVIQGTSMKVSNRGCCW